MHIGGKNSLWNWPFLHISDLWPWPWIGSYNMLYDPIQGQGHRSEMCTEPTDWPLPTNQILFRKTFVDRWTDIWMDTEICFIRSTQTSRPKKVNPNNTIYTKLGNLLQHATTAFLQHLEKDKCCILLKAKSSVLSFRLQTTPLSSNKPRYRVDSFQPNLIPWITEQLTKHRAVYRHTFLHRITITEDNHQTISTNVMAYKSILCYLY